VKVVTYRQVTYAVIVAALLLFRLIWKYLSSFIKTRQPAEEPMTAKNPSEGSLNTILKI
jgi:hypothetical protein